MDSGTVHEFFCANFRSSVCANAPGLHMQTSDPQFVQMPQDCTCKLQILSLCKCPRIAHANFRSSVCANAPGLHMQTSDPQFVQMPQDCTCKLQIPSLCKCPRIAHANFRSPVCANAPGLHMQTSDYFQTIHHNVLHKP